MNIEFTEMIKHNNGQITYIKNKKTHITISENTLDREILCGAKLNNSRWSTFFSLNAAGYIKARDNYMCKNCLAVYNRI